jgi:hypothetical protein
MDFVSCVRVALYVSEVILIRRGWGLSLYRLRTVYLHPSDSPCSTAIKGMNANYDSHNLGGKGWGGENKTINRFDYSPINGGFFDTRQGHLLFLPRRCNGLTLLTPVLPTKQSHECDPIVSR